MNSLRNKVNLIGHLGANPEMIHFDNEKSMARFSIATNEVWYDKVGNKQTDTQWHNCVAWGKVAKSIETLLRKGHEVAIEGKLSNRNYEDKNGVSKRITEIVLNNFLLLTPKTKGES